MFSRLMPASPLSGYCLFTYCMKLVAGNAHSRLSMMVLVDQCTDIYIDIIHPYTSFFGKTKNRRTWSRFTQKQVRPTYNQVKTHFPGHKRDTKATNIFALCIAILLLGLFHLLDDHFYITRNPKQL